MSTRGLEGLVFETHNWGKSVAFWQALGYELKFETDSDSDHHSGRLVHPAGGPYILIAERAESDSIETRLVVGVDDASIFEPPASGNVIRPFTPEHWGVMEMILQDPDGRSLGLIAPLPADVEVIG